MVITVQPPAVRPAPRRSSPTVYVRRRLVALGLLVVALVTLFGVAGRAAAALGDDPASGVERPAATVTARTAVVESGDTLWSIARRLQPEGDVRDLVRTLRKANGGASLRVGERVVLP